MYILADVGGTKTRVAASEDLAHFDEPIVIDTPQSYDDGLTALVAHTSRLAKGQKIDACAVGIAGTLSSDQRVPLSTPHLEWHGNSLAADLEEALGGTAYLANDVAHCGLGEAIFGAGRGVSIMAYVTVSTGVNGARIVDGAIDRAAEGFEIGGQYLSIDPARTFEEFLSGTAIEARTGRHPRDLGKDWVGWEELARVAAYGLYNAITHWSPERIVLGGSMMNEIGIPIESIRSHLFKVNNKYPSLPEVVHSELGDFGGIWGAMAHLAQIKSASPEGFGTRAR